ncbi:hypothetical protein AXF42_Ash021322 [Apostasia shenzhenica]|uniref:Uncharacterized protein n=1 Tax=Apostasia shenzhenica TaxID=1088818 RepID=A0A2H9ZUE3_9ASPA|nr:hypothetical protein AXF42_Ash021322 [Apostasia shenzhenica]
MPHAHPPPSWDTHEQDDLSVFFETFDEFLSPNSILVDSNDFEKGAIDTYNIDMSSTNHAILMEGEMPPAALSQLNHTFSIDEITTSPLPVLAIPDETEGLEEPPTMMPPNESTSSSFHEILDQLRSDPSFVDSLEQEIYNEQMLNSLLTSWQSGDDHEPKFVFQPAETKSNNVIGSDGSGECNYQILSLIP